MSMYDGDIQWRSKGASGGTRPGRIRSTLLQS